MPLQATSGAASYDGFGGGVAAVPQYIEDVFSTYLYTGNGSTQTITNGIDLAGKGGLTWIKARNTVDSNRFFDTSRGIGNYIVSNSTSAQLTNSASVTAFNSNGFSLGSFTGTNDAFNYASWTFRKQPKFFDVVTWTGTGSPMTIPHNLGSVPGCIIRKNLSNPADWSVYHKDVANGGRLNTTDAFIYGVPTNITSTSFDVSGTGSSAGFAYAGDQYVAYLFAHNAGGFGLTGTDNVISCGSYTGTGVADNNVTLGYEPQWVMIKRTDSTGDWNMQDVMRGMSNTDTFYLKANSSSAEIDFGYQIVYPNATGFTLGAGTAGWNASGGNYIYIAIRRGPMKVPTSGTSVFTPITYNGNGTSQTITGSVGVPDLGLGIGRSGGQAGQNAWYDRLRGKELALRSTNTTAEYNASPGGEGTMTNTMNGMRVENTYGILDDGTTPYILYFLTRAPSFFDEVCYTGTGTATTVAHNLGVVPELMIVKTRSLTGQDWAVYSATLGNTGLIYLNQAAAANTGYGHWNSTSPTSTVFSLGGGGYNMVNGSGATYVNYLFATCAGVSKVGSYTGNGSTQTINCGFTGGARFVLIKKTSGVGDWYVYDTARGIVSGNDPYLSLNTTAAEVTTDDTIDTDSTGFVVNQVTATNVNVSSATYIYLAIA